MSSEFLPKRPLKKTYSDEVLDFAVYDGDTVKVFLDKGHETYSTQSIRLYQLDCPEIVSKNPLERDAAALSRDCAAIILNNANDKQIDCESIAKNKTLGRYVGNFYLYKYGATLNRIMIDIGAARVLIGDKNSPWSDEDLKKIITKCEEFIKNPKPVLDQYAANITYAGSYI